MYYLKYICLSNQKCYAIVLRDEYESFCSNPNMSTEQRSNFGTVLGITLSNVLHILGHVEQNKEQ